MTSKGDPIVDPTVGPSIGLAINSAIDPTINLTRRATVRLLGAASASLLTNTSLSAFAATEDPRGMSPAKPFPLHDVRLLDGPFLEAQRRTERYLLQLSPDRLLHNFRVNAGLQPKAAVYGGWESQEPWVDIRCHGHTLGHYLSGCAHMYASTGKAEFRNRCDYIVTELQACQAKSAGGLICAFPDGATQLQNSVSGKPFVGVPWYTMHKIFAGLRDVFVHRGNPVALDVLVRLSDWALSATQAMSDADFQRMLDREHGGMSEVLADAHTLTREAKYLELSTRFVHRALLTPLAAGVDPLDGLHSNTQIPKVIGYARLHDLTAREEYRTAATFFWKTVVTTRSFATGGNSDVEFFFPRGEFTKRLDSPKTMETCCFYNMLRLTRTLFETAPSAAYADYYERALYNGILASQDPDSGMVTYFQPTRPGYLKLYCTPEDSFWCCTGSGMENHAKYGDSIYFHDAASLYVNLFIPSMLTWKERGLVLEQSTSFPDSTTSRLQLSLSGPTRLRLRLRHPYWCEVMTVKINGRTHAVHRERSSYIDIEREWQHGDVVELDIPMHLRTEPLPGNTGIVAILYGPLVLAGRYGNSGITPGADLIVNERKTGEMLDVPLALPTWNIDAKQPSHQLQPAASPLTFVGKGIVGRDSLEFIPYQRIAHERYNLYWRLASASA